MLTYEIVIILNDIYAVIYANCKLITCIFWDSLGIILWKNSSIKHTRHNNTQLILI